MNFLHVLANIDAYQACWVNTDNGKSRTTSTDRRIASIEPRVPSIEPSVSRTEHRVAIIGPWTPRTGHRTPSTDSRVPSTVRFPGDQTRGLRPSSVQESVSHVSDFRPKSSKSLTFQLDTDRVSPALSVSTAEFKFKKRDVKTPVSATRVSISRLGFTSGGSTVLSYIREGARSPTPNALDQMELAFHDIEHDRYGLTIWRIQGSTLQLLEDVEFGFFHEGNVYIVLNINRDNERSLHVWNGNDCAESDAKFAAEKALELDKIICGAHIFSREVQLNESTVFLRLFPDGIVYTEGKHKMGITKSSTYDKRMYVVSGRKYARAECVHPRKDYLKSKAVAILDSFPRIYVWIGQTTGYVLRNKGIRIARKIQQKQRNGRCHIVIIDECDDHLRDAFKRKFDEPIIPAQTKSGDDTVEYHQAPKDEEIHMVLYRISGDHVLYDMAEAAKRPLHRCYLTKRDSYLLDRGQEKTMFMWVGSQAMEDEDNHAVTRAESFSLHNNYSMKGSVCRIREDHEPTEFKQCFCDWKDRLSKDMSVTKRYSAGNIGRALCSRTDKRTIATVKECWSEDKLGDLRKTTQVWVLTNDRLEPWGHTSLFTNDKCFIVLHTTIEMSHFQHIIYYWVGSKSAPEDRHRIMQLAQDKDAELNHSTVLIRVLDYKEPQHFLTVLHDWMIVYDGSKNIHVNTETASMFCVRDFGERGIRIQQVVPDWENLNSSAAFVILVESDAYLWYGKASGSTEREAAKELLSILCSARMFSYYIVTEGKEPSLFTNLLGTKTSYDEKYKEKILERRPPCLLVYEFDTSTVTNIDDFQQEDLSEEDVYVLDTYDQIFVWCGERVAEEQRRKLFDLAKDYIRQDPAGRDFALVSLWVVSQRSEPVAFTKHFRSWNALGYSGRHAYEVSRKRIRQENAKIDINQTMVDTSFLTQPKYPYKVLLKKDLPHDVDDTNKHNHLSEKHFREHLKICWLDFYNLPLWKQHQILRSARLLYVPRLTTKPFSNSNI